MTRPLESEYAPFYRGYVAHVGEEEILPVLRSQLDHLDVLLGQVTPERETYAYAEGKWSIRELTGHLIDAERVFGYRAFCIARGESRNLPGFDEKEYLLRAPYNPVVRDALLETLFASGSNLLLLPMSDVFGWRDRINIPAKVDADNWTFRLPWPVDRLNEQPEARERQEALRAWTERYARG